MSKRKTNNYSSEFKESAIKLALNSDQPVSETASELGISKSTLQTWISKHTKLIEGSNTRTDEHLYEELKRLKKKILALKKSAIF